MSAVYWACVPVSERKLVLKNGFYRMFQRYLNATGALTTKPRQARVNGVRYPLLNYDCFQQRRRKIHIFHPLC